MTWTTSSIPAPTLTSSAYRGNLVEPTGRPSKDRMCHTLLKSQMAVQYRTAVQSTAVFGTVLYRTVQCSISLQAVQKGKNITAQEFNQAWQHWLFKGLSWPTKPVSIWTLPHQHLLWKAPQKPYFQNQERSFYSIRRYCWTSGTSRIRRDNLKHWDLQ